MSIQQRKSNKTDLTEVKGGKKFKLIKVGKKSIGERNFKFHLTFILAAEKK